MEQSASELHREAIVVDGLCSSTLTKEYLTETLPEAGINIIHGSIIRSGKSRQEAINSVLEVQRVIHSCNGVSQVTSPSDLRSSDGVRVVFGFQDTTPMEDDPDNIRLFDQLGVKIMQLTYNERNLSGNGCTERADGGISNFGLNVVDAIETHNILLDLSHVGHQTAADALSVSTQPTVFTHSNPSAVKDHPRNISDKLIEAVAATGGTIGVNAYPDFVASEPTIEDLLNHLDYLVDIVGTEHVSLGLDFIDNRLRKEPEKMEHLEANPHYSNPPYTYPEGIRSAADVPNVTEALLERGYSEDEIKAILGENLLRVYETVWG